MGNVGAPPKVKFKGCEDHLLNLMSKDFEKYLVTNSSACIYKKHHATDVVQFIIAKVIYFFYSTDC